MQSIIPGAAEDSARRNESRNGLVRTSSTSSTPCRNYIPIRSTRGARDLPPLGGPLGVEWELGLVFRGYRFARPPGTLWQASSLRDQNSDSQAFAFLISEIFAFLAVKFPAFLTEKCEEVELVLTLSACERIGIAVRESPAHEGRLGVKTQLLKSFTC